MKICRLLHLFKGFKSLFYRRYYFKSKTYRDLVSSDRKKALDVMWRFLYGKGFPWKDPQTLNEKISFLSVATDTSMWTKCTDKYDVRSYVESLGLAHILTQCFGVWEKAEDINFDDLPPSFVLKCTHDCGSAIIVHDKNSSDFNMEDVRERLRYYLSRSFGYSSCEPHYCSIRPRIIAEELIEHHDVDGFKSTSMVDYKFWAFNGKARYCMVVYNRERTNEGHALTLDLYNLFPWKQMDRGLTSLYDSRFRQKVPKPDCLKDMIDIVERLSAMFPVVRVDLYCEAGKIYFGELTFTSAGGRMEYYTEEFQKELGALIELPEDCNRKTD